MKSKTYREKLDDILKLDQFEEVTNTRKNAKEMCFKEEDRINETLNKLYKDGKLSESLYNEMKATGGQIRKLYGTAKVHKNNVPVRPVLSMPGSPYYKIADRITKWLSIIPESQISCSTKNTVDKLKNVTLDPNEVMISFDVSSS